MKRWAIGWDKLFANWISDKEPISRMYVCMYVCICVFVYLCIYAFIYDIG